MQLTPNYRLRKPDGTDPVDVQDLNDNMDVLDAEVVKKLDKTGDASNVVNKFSQAGNRTNLTSGEKLSISLGKIMKWFADLKTVAFSGKYSDLTDRPTIPAGGIADKSKIIDNLDDIAANTQAGYMAGALAVKELNSDLGGCALSQEGNDFYITGADAVRKKLGSARYLGSVQNTWVTLNPIITIPYEGNLIPSDAENIRIVLNPDALGKVFMGSRYVPDKAWLVMDAYTVEIDTTRKQITIKITLRTNGNGIGNCEFRCNFDIYLLSF